MASAGIIGLGILILVISIVWSGQIAGQCNTFLGGISQAISAEAKSNCQTQTMLSQAGMLIGVVIAGYGIVKGK